MSTRRTSRDRSVVWAFRVELHGDDAGRDVGDEHRDEERRDLPRSALAIDVMLLLEASQPSDPASDNDADTIGIQSVRLGQAGVFHCLVGCTNRVLCELVSPFGFFPIHVGQRIEIFDLRRELDRKIRCVEMRDRCGSRFSIQQRTPSRRHVVSDWRYRSHAGDDDPSTHYAVTLLFR